LPDGGTRFSVHAPGWPPASLAVVCEWYAIRALQCLDDRMLADLGVSRGEIAFVVRGGRPARERPATPASLRARAQRQQAA
jgi:hypothetical protein